MKRAKHQSAEELVAQYDAIDDTDEESLLRWAERAAALLRAVAATRITEPPAAPVPNQGWGKRRKP